MTLDDVCHPLRRHLQYLLLLIENTENRAQIVAVILRLTQLDTIHLLPSLEGDTKICPTQKIHVARVSLQTGQLIVYYTESCSTTLYSAERCAMRHDREHDDLFSLHVTSLDQSYFLICHINYMRYNNIGYHVDYTALK